MDKTFLQVEENSDITEPLVDISIPEGQQVTLGSSSTPSAFRILGNQLFLNVIPDYEVQAAAWGGVYSRFPHTGAHSPCWRFGGGQGSAPPGID